MSLLEIIQNERRLAASAFSGDERAAQELLTLGAVSKMNNPESQEAVFKGFVDGIDRVLTLIKQNPPQPKQKPTLDITL